MHRRTYVVTAGVGTAALLAGCLDDIVDGDDDSSNDGDEGGGTNEPDEHGAVVAVESYFEALIENDLDGLADVMHSKHPFNPDSTEIDEVQAGDWEYEMPEVERYDVELEDDEFESDEIEDVPYVDLWFDDVEIADVVEGEEAALVTLEYEAVVDDDTIESKDRLIALTEEDEWTVFFEYLEPPTIPEGEPVEDEEYRIVDGISFDVAHSRASVSLADSIPDDVEAVIVYSTSFELDTRATDAPGVEEFPFTEIVSEFDPEGDEIVVSVIVDDDEELVVHREEYQP